MHDYFEEIIHLATFAEDAQIGCYSLRHTKQY